MALPSIGSLRERVEFQRRPLPGDSPSTADDIGNEVTGDFAAQFQRAARIQPFKGIGDEVVQAARLGGTQPMIIRVHSDADTITVTTGWRIRDVNRGTIYNIRSFANMDEWGKFIDFLCASGGASD